MQTDATESRGYRSYTIASFARWARIYDAFVALLQIEGVRRQTVDMSGVQPGDRVLDVSTGTGEVALAFARQCDDVTGVDLSPDMLAVARGKDPEGKIRFMQMDATRMDFDDGEFDISSISFGLHDMPPDVREKVLKEMARVTRRWIVIVDYNPPQNSIVRTLYIGLVSLYESKYFAEFASSDFEGLLARCGLEMVKKKPVYGGVVRLCLVLPNR
jgi:demethylmenaquinone methyltransferase/2-methoxy-6-polyprenyl-1,4-benzoquinol methylase